MPTAGSIHPATRWKDPFTERTAKGLFSAPWLESPTDETIAAIHQLSESLVSAPTHPEDLSVALGYLLAVQSHCKQAARTREWRKSLEQYNHALRDCEIILSRLAHSKGGTPAALFAWAQGVHTLIRAQVAMVNQPTAARLMAYEGLHQLSGIVDPLCAGAQADALSAMLLVREPAELEARLAALPDEIRALADETTAEFDRKEGELNHALIMVHQHHEKALALASGWGLLNLLLLATLPLNGLYGTQMPWSLPFLVALPVLWYFTWGRPYENNLPFFDWLRHIRRESLQAFRQAAASLPQPDRFHNRAKALLRQGWQDQERLSTFYLHQLPDERETCWKAQAVADGVEQRLSSGTWMVELNDRAPWPLADVLPTEPSMIPGITRVRFGSSQH